MSASRRQGVGILTLVAVRATTLRKLRLGTADKVIFRIVLPGRIV